MNSRERVKYLEKRVEKLESALQQLRVGRKVLMNLLERCQQDKAKLETELPHDNCFTCAHRQKTLLKKQHHLIR